MAADRKDELVLSAIRALAREGVPAGTTRAIAAEAGVNVATLHYHFGGKEQLVAAVMEVVSKQHADIFRAAIPTDAGLETGFAYGIRRVLEFVQGTPQLQLLQYELTLAALRGDDVEGRRMAIAQYEAYLSVTRELIAEILEASSQQIAVAVDDLAVYVVAGLDGLILQILVAADLVTDRLVSMFVDGVIAVARPHPSMPVAVPPRPLGRESTRERRRAAGV